MFPNRSRVALVCAVVPMLAPLGCAGLFSDPGGAPGELQQLPRPLTAAEVIVQNAANQFSFALWNRLNAAQPDSNIFVSPLSASFALGMTLNGAANESFDQMRSALQYGETDQRDINEGYKSLIALLTSLDSRVTMDIANSIWYRRDYPILEGFLDTTRSFFSATVRGLDFTDVSGSLGTINGWVSDNTGGKIPSIVDEIDGNTIMFLINAVYFNARWRTEFDPAKTLDEQFRASDGSVQPVRMMHRAGSMRYARGPGWQAVDLPYGNTAFSMTVVLPNENEDVEAVAASMTPETWSQLTAAFDSAEVDLALPKFRLAYGRLLKDDLRALGMEVPFIAGGADFTRMSPRGRELYIYKVTQKAFVEVDELGTEAAAVTVVENRRTIGDGRVHVQVDRPFIFVIRERLSGTVVFIGKLLRMP